MVFPQSLFSFVFKDFRQVMVYTHLVLGDSNKYVWYDKLAFTEYCWQWKLLHYCSHTVVVVVVV